MARTNKIKVIDQELKDRCRGGDIESLKESLKILIHNDIVRLKHVESADKFRFIQGHLQSSEEILNMLLNK